MCLLAAALLFLVPTSSGSLVMRIRLHVCGRVVYVYNMKFILGSVQWAGVCVCVCIAELLYSGL